MGSQRPPRPNRPSRPDRPKRPDARNSHPEVLPPIQLKPKDPSGKKVTAEAEEELPNVEPLTEEEKAVQKSQRNDLLNLLSKNRKTNRPGGASSRPTASSRPVGPSQSQDPKKESSALENLFSIITTSSSSSSSTSSSSSSSGGGVRVRPHGRKQSKKKKGRPSNSPSPTEDPELQSLSPQERLVKKVKETLVVPPLAPQDRPRGVRKKVILRKEKPEGQLPREGRRLGGGGSKIKTKKIRIRRPEEEAPAFPIVY